MTRSPGRSWSGWLGPITTLCLALLATGCADHYHQSTLAPKSDITTMIDDVFRTTVGWATVVFVLVEAALLYAIFRFRERPGGAEPEQTHGNTKLEVIWTIIPAVILAFIAVPTVRTIFKTSLPAENPEVEVEVIGHQWWWEFRYPKLGVVTANEMNVPTGKTIALRMWTADVLHSFWSPQLASKRDLFQLQAPNRKKINPLWFKTDTTGVFAGQCAEYCGTQHARMALRVVVQPQAEFDQWVAQQRVGSPLVEGGKLPAAVDSAAKADSIIAKGRTAFTAAGCLGCHAMVGTPLAGALTLRGPNLSHMGSRLTIGAGMYENTPTNLANWLRDPQKMKKGSHMILPRELTEAEVTALVAYLRAHK